MLLANAVPLFIEDIIPAKVVQNVVPTIMFMIILNFPTPKTVSSEISVTPLRKGCRLVNMVDILLAKVGPLTIEDKIPDKVVQKVVPTIMFMIVLKFPTPRTVSSEIFVTESRKG